MTGCITFSASTLFSCCVIIITNEECLKLGMTFWWLNCPFGQVTTAQFPVWKLIDNLSLYPSRAWPQRYPKLKLTSDSAQLSLFSSLIPKGLCIWDGVKRLPYVSKFFLLQDYKIGRPRRDETCPFASFTLWEILNICGQLQFQRSKFRVKIPGIWPKGRTLKSSQEKGRWSGRREFQESWKRERERN